MRIECFRVGELETNCYFLINDITKELAIVDPGDVTSLIFEHVENSNLKPTAILLTHGHFDHIGGVEKWLEKYPDIKIYAGEFEKEMLEDADKNLSHRWASKGVTLKDVYYLKDGDTLSVVGNNMTILYTPGHTIGGIEFYIPTEKILIAGDSVFYHNIGRTDLPTGNYKSLISSLKEKVATLPEDVKILTGHGPATTVGDEKRFNPYIR